MLLPSTAILSIYLVFGYTGAPKATLPTAIKLKTKEMATAFRHKNALWLGKNSITSFVAIDRTKRYNLDEALDQMRKLFTMTTSVETVTADIVRYKPVGDSFVVTTRTMFKGMVKGPNGKVGKLVDDSTDDLTWVRAGSGWKIAVDKTVTEHATLDGKPIG